MYAYIYKLQQLKKTMELTIKFEDLLGLTIGQIAAMTNEFIKQNPQFKTAEQILKENVNKS